MTGINHILVGGIIGATVATPVALPLAFASHFLLDALPHYGIDEGVERSKDWVWKVDAVLIAIFAIYMYSASFDVRLWAIASAVAAVSPDFAWIYRFSVKERFGKTKPQETKNKFNQFHADIQKHESKDLLWVEAVVLIVLIGVFGNIIN